MQVTFRKSGPSPLHNKIPERLHVQVPGYVSTSSWTDSHDLDAGAQGLQKGRILTPPPAAVMGLHQLTLEAFWID